MLAKGDEVPPIPGTFWEVTELAKEGAYCILDDMETSILMENPGNLHIDMGDIVEVNSDGQISKHADSAEPHSFADAEALSTYAEELAKATRHVPFKGPADAKLVFVSASPSPLELARKEALAGPDGALFLERYLEPLGLTKNDVATGFAIPVQCGAPTSDDIELWRGELLKTLAVYNRAKVVALGRVAKEALGPLVAYSLPHPAAVRRHGDRGELGRKLKTICKALDIAPVTPEPLGSSKVDPSHGETGATLADSISELNGGGSLRVAVTKSAEEKQIVYGVILDPYQVDLHNDWLPPAEIESTAHDFLAKSRVIGLRHNGVAEAEIVESWVELYPTEKDRELALENLPHKVYRRQFGADSIHSGAWVAGVKLSDSLWAAHKAGDLDAFSIGGFSFKTKISTDAMPEVEIVDLQPAN
jgi:uracil-DNA glycosylase